jgi:hypothetical protein
MEWARGLPVRLQFLQEGNKKAEDPIWPTAWDLQRLSRSGHLRVGTDLPGAAAPAPVRCAVVAENELLTEVPLTIR